jgi:hypothetical protein
LRPSSQDEDNGRVLTGCAGTTQAEDKDLHGDLAAACSTVDVGVVGEYICDGTRLVLGGLDHGFGNVWVSRKEE